MGSEAFEGRGGFVSLGGSEAEKKQQREPNTDTSVVDCNAESKAFVLMKE